MSILKTRPVSDPGAQLNFEAIEDALHVGNGSPEGVVAAAPGALYQDRQGGGIYRKASGTANTGWLAVSGAPGGAGGPTTRAFNSAQPLSIPSGGGANVVPFDAEDYDTAGLHDAAATAVALSGTVAKTAASNALVGTGTAFTTQLKVGDRITVPGGANETKFVFAITDNTHLTVDSNFANTAAGQAATVNRSGRMIVVRAGVYLCVGQITYAASGSAGQRQARLHKNGALFAQTTQQGLGAAINVAMEVVECVLFAVGDVIELCAFQNSGVVIDTVAANPLSLSMTLVGTV